MKPTKIEALASLLLGLLAGALTVAYIFIR